MARKGPPLGNKNAAGPHNMHRGRPDKMVEYQTGALGAFGLGKKHTGWGITDKKTGATYLYDEKGKLGLPSNTTRFKEYKLKWTNKK